MARTLLSLALLVGCGSDAPTEPGNEAFGPENSWFHADTADVPADLQGTGYEVGDVMPDFTLVDQFGDEVQLYQFYGQVVALDVLALWCIPCQDAAPEHQALWEELRGEDFAFIAVVTDGYGPAPVASDAADWAETFGLTHPVVADPARERTKLLSPAYPTVVLLDRELRVLDEDVPPEELDTIRAAVRGG